MIFKNKNNPRNSHVHDELANKVIEKIKDIKSSIEEYNPNHKYITFFNTFYFFPMDWEYLCCSGHILDSLNKTIIYLEFNRYDIKIGDQKFSLHDFPSKYKKIISKETLAVALTIQEHEKTQNIRKMSKSLDSYINI